MSNFVRSLLSGWISGVKHTFEENRFDTTIVGCEAQLESAKRDVTTENCANVFGDRRCRFAITTELCAVLGTANDGVVSIEKNGSFTFAATPSEYVAGFVHVLTGPNAGAMTDVIEFISVNTGSATIRLSETFPIKLGQGTVLRISIGCTKTMARCSALGNIQNYRGFPYVPGTRSYTAGSNLEEVT